MQHPRPSRLGLVALVVCMAACTRVPPKPEPLPPDEDAAQAHAGAELRMAEATDPYGLVAVKGASGEWKHLGDAVWRTGLALFAESRAAAELHEAALIRMLERTRGGIYRHPTVPAKPSLDTALGLYLGAAHSIARLGHVGLWHDALKGHEKWNDGGVLAGGWDYVRDVVLWRAGLAGEPHPDRRVVLESVITQFAQVVRFKIDHHDAGEAPPACYRFNLGWMALRTVELLGVEISAPGRQAFCQHAGGLGLELIDHWCGKADALDALTGPAWTANVWDFKPQRCAGWEEPDCTGDQCGGVDRAAALVEKYDFVF